jgi:PAS domain S-box-containing protein
LSIWEWLLNPAGLTAHGFCLSWEPGLVALHAGSDALIGLAYFSIPLAMAWFVWQRHDFQHWGIAYLFAAFILACGATHLFSILTLWVPVYGIEGLVKALTAVLSISTAVILWPLVPRLLALPTPELLVALNTELSRRVAAQEEATAKLRDSEACMRSLNEDLERRVAERTSALKRTVEEFRTLADGIPPLCWMAEPDGRIYWFNRRWFEYTGTLPAESRTSGPAMPPLVLERWHASLATGEPFEMTLPIRGADGLFRPFMTRVAPVRDDEGRVVRWLGVNTDVTEATERATALEVEIVARRDAEERFRQVIESAPTAMIMIDGEGAIELVNIQTERTFGYSREELLGRSVDILLPDRLRANHGHHRATFFAAPMPRAMGIGQDLFGRRKDGSEFSVEIGLNPLMTQQGQKVISSISDITRRKEIERAMGDMAEKEKDYMRDLERSNQELDDFAHIASHDLKEPLRGLFNHASFLLEDYSDKIDEDGVRRLTRLGELCQRMERLINDLMYFSRLGRADLAVRETDPNAIIVEIRQMMETLLSERHARIVVPRVLPKIICDKTRVTEVFRNLITNAVKYNDKSERLIEVGFLESVDTRERPERSVFYVRDNGVGIDPDFHQEIFRIFKRLQDSSDATDNGTGVGLTFVKKIVERHGGRIWLESEPGEGTVFYFSLDHGRNEPVGNAHD